MMSITLNDEVIQGAVGADVAAGVDGDAGRVEVEREGVRTHHPLDAAVALKDRCDGGRGYGSWSKGPEFLSRWELGFLSL